jgi:hypothetical protein
MAQSQSNSFARAISAIGPDSPDHSPVLVAESPQVALPADPDEALKLAIKTAVDAGDFDRVRALVAVLGSAPKKASVVDIASRRPAR